MYHILYKTPLLELPTGVTIDADNPIDALTTFNSIYYDVVFIVMYKLNEKGNFEW